MNLAASLPCSRSVGHGSGPFCTGHVGCPGDPSTPRTPRRGHGFWPYYTPWCYSGWPFRSDRLGSQGPRTCSEGGVFGVRHSWRTHHLRKAPSSWATTNTTTTTRQMARTRMRCVCRPLPRDFPQGQALGQTHAQKAATGRLARALARLPFEAADVAELEVAPSPVSINHRVPTQHWVDIWYLHVM